MTTQAGYSSQPWTAQRLLGAAGLAAACVFVGWSVTDPGRLRVIFAATGIWLLVAIGVSMPRRLLYALVIWLTALGLLRRLASGVATATLTDPFLLVGPAVVVILVLAAAHAGAFRRRTRLSAAVLALNVLTLLGVLNPLQGNILTGLGGLLFILVPTLAFWIGRGLCDDRTFTRVMRLVAGIAVVEAVYGLDQALRGFFPWDARWIARSGYAALSVGGVTRPFASFSSGGEFGSYLAIAVVVWAAFGFGARRFALTLAALALLGTAIVYESARGIVVMTIGSLGLMAAVRHRFSMVASGIVAAAFLGAFFLGLRAWHSSAGPAIESPLVAHQLDGLAHPFDPRYSTLPDHLAFFGEGLGSVTSYPLGLGTGSITIASWKFGGVQRGTEADFSNMAVGLGIPGLLAYLVVVVRGFRQTYRLACARTDPLSLAALAILAVTAVQWLNGGHYAVVFLPWLVLGWVDRHEVHSTNRLLTKRFRPSRSPVVPAPCPG